ncbi:DUF4321 domain-containing protein [bacterium]|nr:DUF4321 domain-containing protein [bacterium]
MALLKGRIGSFLWVMFISTLVGTVAGEIFGVLIPEGFWHNVFAAGPKFQLGPAPLDLVVLSITIGFGLKINLCGLLGIISGLLIYRKL